MGPSSITPSVLTLYLATLPLVLPGPATAAAQSIGSSRYAPSTPVEVALLAQADRSIQPGDVRADPARFEQARVVWTGIARRPPASGPDDAVPTPHPVVVEHHYFDFAVELDHSVWLSSYGEGDFCLLDLPAPARRAIDRRRAPFVIAYGRPVVIGGRVCLGEVTLVVTDFRWTTMIADYGPNGTELPAGWDPPAHVMRNHPEAAGYGRFGYRLTVALAFGTSFEFDGDDPVGGVEVGARVESELAWRFGLRNELAIGVGLADLSDLAVPNALGLDHASLTLLYRHYIVGVGAAIGAVLYAPFDAQDATWLGLRYSPFLGDAQGDWGLAFLSGGALDLLYTPEVRWAAHLNFAIGIDGNLGRAGGVECDNSPDNS